jgi:hypothetical protein
VAGGLPMRYKHERMTRAIACRFAAVVALLVAVPVTTFAGPDSEPFLERLLDTRAFSFGVSEPSFWDLGAPANLGERERTLNADPRGKAISFDLKLKWPGAETMPVEPYLTVGPALIVSEPDSFSALAGTRVDPAPRLGAKVGGGLNWRLGKDTTLFGAYGFTTDSPNGLLTDGPRTRGDAGNTGFDLMYGIRFRY